MRLVDTHTHLYLDRFDADRDACAQRARDAAVDTLVLPAIDVPSIHAALALCDRYERTYAMSALHPSETKTATDDDFEAVRALCDDPRVVAVGESGLDYFWDRSFDDAQHDFLRRHVRLALDTDLPLVLHTRDKRGEVSVFEDTLRILREERARHERGKHLRGIFHCFSGPLEIAREVLDLGFLLGIGGVITFKNGGLAEVAAELPLEAFVLETDAPFLAPAPHRGKRNEPAYTRLVAEKLAEVKAVPLEEVARVTTRNATELFGIA
jgi:TatD DNase family protein